MNFTPTTEEGCVLRNGVMQVSRGRVLRFRIWLWALTTHAC
jgi:hypothetical protein